MADGGPLVRVVEQPENDLRYVPDAFVGTIEPNYFCRGWNGKRQKYCRAPAGRNTNHPGRGRCNYHGGNTPIQHGRYAKVLSDSLRDLIEDFEHDPELLDLEADVAAMRGLFVDFINRYHETTEALLAWHQSFILRNVELPEEKIMAFERVIAEWEIAIQEERVEPTPKQVAEIADARKFIDYMRGRGESFAKPRKVLDISDAYKLLEGSSRIVERIEKIRAENAISRQEFIRLTHAMGRVVLKHVKDPKTLEAIRKGWLDINVA